MMSSVTFTFVGEAHGRFQQWLADGVRRVLVARGHRYCPKPPRDIRVVFNIIDAQRPRPFRRRTQATFVVAIAEADTAAPQPAVRLRAPLNGHQPLLKVVYPLLVRSLSNLVLYIIPGEQGPTVYGVTPELGCYTIPPAESDERFFAQLYERLLPVAASRLIINNIFVADLPPGAGDAQAEQLRRAGQRLAALSLLPAPFPLEELLSPALMRHLYRLYGIGGLSYGNLSIRRDATSFWMSASGVDKGNLQHIGRDILLITGYDANQSAMVVSVPPQVEPRRASVDAIEHWLVYHEHPEVGAIVHVHAWMDGVSSTAINYPCGTIELAQAVAELVRQAPDPARAVVGLKNHGLTITGPDMDDIFARIEERLLRQIPMSF